MKEDVFRLRDRVDKERRGYEEAYARMRRAFNKMEKHRKAVLRLLKKLSRAGEGA